MSFYDIIQALLGWLKNSSAFSAKMAQLYNSVYMLPPNFFCAAPAGELRHDFRYIQHQ